MTLRRTVTVAALSAAALVMPHGMSVASGGFEASRQADDADRAPVVREIATASTSTSSLSTATMTVAAALDNQGSEGTVRGFIVGQPVGTGSVIDTDFSGDTAIALADDPDETDPSKMLFVQVPSSFRADMGLATNPDLLGQQVDVTGALEAYFGQPGLKGASAMDLVDGGGDDGGDGGDADPGDYYAPAEGKEGEELRTALHDIISKQKVISYDQVWDALKQTDEDPGNSNNVIQLYTGWSVPKSQHGGDADDWNREHVWAKSHGDFGTRNGPGTDVHHLRPTDSSVNSSRGNKDFAAGGEEHDEAEGNFSTPTSWEPRDEVKGDVARMILYMDVRYEGNDDFPDLQVNDELENGSDPYHGKVSELLEWHRNDPPSDAEKRRNEVIFTDIQGNRNPFIDHPEFVDSIYGAALTD